MELRQHDRDYLAVLEELGGEATTTEIRERTEMDGRQVNYRHEKLAKNGIVNIELDNSLTADGAAGMQVAELTDKGWELIQRGEAVNGDVEETTEERLDELEETIDGAIPWMNEMVARVRRIEAFLEERGADLDGYADVEDFH